MIDILKTFAEGNLTLEMFSQAPKSIAPKVKLIGIVKNPKETSSYLMYEVTLRKTEKYTVFVGVHFYKTPIESDLVSSTFYRDFGWYSRHSKQSYIRDEDHKAVNMAYHIRKMLINSFDKYKKVNLKDCHFKTPTSVKFYFCEKYMLLRDEIKNNLKNKTLTIKYFSPY